jgi:hypothetical protein
MNLRGELVAITSDINQGNDVNSELAENRSNDIEIEDIRLRAFFRKAFDRLGSRNGQKANTHEHSTDSDLSISELDTLEVQNAQTVSADQAVKCENLVHLYGSHQGATTLSNDVGNSDDVAEFASQLKHHQA